MSDTKTVNTIDEDSPVEQDDETKEIHEDKSSFHCNDQQVDREVSDAITEAQDGFEKDFTIEVGMTILEDKLSGNQYSAYKAILTDESTNEETIHTGEHPADAVLGCIEKATNGVY